VVCLRSEGVAEVAHGFSSDTTAAIGLSPGELADLRPLLEGETLLRRLPTVADLANVATFMASDRAAAMTGSVANVSCGGVVV
jgi:3-oxoacyl-[acyl-carrier protein] reductase